MSVNCQQVRPKNWALCFAVIHSQNVEIESQVLWSAVLLHCQSRETGSQVASWTAVIHGQGGEIEN